MSSEHYHSPAGDAESLYTAIYATDNEIRYTLDTIAGSRPDQPQAEEQYDWMISRSREIAIATLSYYVIDIMSKQGRVDVIIDTDNPMAIMSVFETPEESYLNASPRTADAAITEGAELGMKDFLNILAPEEITSPVDRAIYGHPWNRHVAETALDRSNPYFHKIPAIDNSLYVYQPTRLPNIIISSFYGPDETTPARAIQVKRSIHR